MTCQQLNNLSVQIPSRCLDARQESSVGEASLVAEFLVLIQSKDLSNLFSFKTSRTRESALAEVFAKEFVA